MLPHKKNEREIRSNPISRIRSYQKLTNGSNVNLQSLLPSTPSTYIPSSLNPVSSARENIDFGYNKKEALHSYKNEGKIKLMEEVNEFENKLNELTTSVTLFKDEQMRDALQSIIKNNDSINIEIDKLDEHQRLGKEIEKIENKEREIALLERTLLKELVYCRNELKKLPRLPTKSLVKHKERNPYDKFDERVDVEEALRYAMKLAKFTRAPPVVGNLQYQIHPNNYIWPAEDALRRGTLAQSLLKEQDIIKAEIGENYSLHKEKLGSPESKLPLKDESKSNSLPTYVPKENENQESNDKNNEDKSMIDLDLFDPDADISD